MVMSVQFSPMRFPEELVLALTMTARSLEDPPLSAPPRRPPLGFVVQQEEFLCALEECIGGSVFEPERFAAASLDHLPHSIQNFPSLLRPNVFLRLLLGLLETVKKGEQQQTKTIAGRQWHLGRPMSRTEIPKPAAGPPDGLSENHSCFPSQLTVPWLALPLRRGLVRGSLLQLKKESDCNQTERPKRSQHQREQKLSRQQRNHTSQPAVADLLRHAQLKGLQEWGRGERLTLALGANHGDDSAPEVRCGPASISPALTGNAPQTPHDLF